MKPLISIVTPCYNEEENIAELYERISKAILSIDKYHFEIIFIDNASTDKTVALLRDLTVLDPRVKVIVNNRNFGQVRSPYWGVMQSKGTATVYLASDLQDPPERIPQFIEQWEKGWKIVLAVKPVSQTNLIFNLFRRLYYRLLSSISDVELIRDATGFGIYDCVVLNHIREIKDPYPYFRGLICELGFPIQTISFDQPRRARGFSKNNFFSLYDVAMLGIVSHSMLPLRIASIFGFFLGSISIVSALIYLALKLIYWNSFPVGVAPLIITIFFMFGLLFIFIGLLGEYVASIQTYLKNRPIVVEKERINF
jgi:dolichol-phosphate mannosyltransferase